MNMEYFLGILCGLAVGAILVILVLKWTKKDGSSKCRYDERQQLIRGRGFKAAFFTLLICNALYAIEDMVMEENIIDSFIGIMLCIVISAVVYACYCIWNEGYFALNENPKKVLIIFGLTALLNFAVFARGVFTSGIIEDGVLAVHCMNFLCGMMLLIVFAVMLAKYLKNKREAE